MSTFVLIHGAAHGAWCWRKLVPLLEQASHTVIAPDLPSHGADNTPVTEVTLQAYTNRVCEILDSRNDLVILVGHSMAGLVIGQTAEYRPERIAGLVYLTAMVPVNGKSMFETGAEIGKPGNIIASEDGLTYHYNPDRLKALFYGDCTDEDVAFAVSNLVPQPLRPVQEPVQLSPEKYGRVRKVYIECERDGIIPITFQRKMYAPIGCERVFTMDTGHSPFLSAPETLANILLSLV